MTSKAVRVVIADDHPVVRAGLAATLATDSQIATVGSAASFAEVLLCLKDTAVDVVVLDLGGMGSAPLTMVVRLQRDYPNVGCVIFSSSVDLAPELLQVGVGGYVVKEELGEHLHLAIHAVHAKERYLSPLVQAYLDRTPNVHYRQKPTPKELEALKLLAKGMSTTEIAKAMEIDPRSAQNHITEMRRKTGSQNRLQLVMWYQRVYGEAEE